MRNPLSLVIPPYDWLVGQSLSSSGQVIHPYHSNDSWGLEGPLKHSRTGDLSGRLV